jgi:hypothetical protein
MNDGHFFEVSPSDTSIVWEYINPITRSGIKKIKTDTYPTDNAAFRAYRYSKDHPALKGKTLTPGKTLTGFDPDFITKSEITSASFNKEYLKPSDVLEQNFPNPFSSQTTIGFEIEEAKKVNVTIYDLAGNQVKTVINTNYPSGKYSVTWDGTSDNGRLLSNGIYFYVLKADEQLISKKMIYTK